jgi:hypothetical protein
VSARLHASLQARLPAALQTSTASSARKSKMLYGGAAYGSAVFIYVNLVSGI